MGNPERFVHVTGFQCGVCQLERVGPIVGNALKGPQRPGGHATSITLAQRREFPSHCIDNMCDQKEKNDEQNYDENSRQMWMASGSASEFTEPFDEAFEEDFCPRCCRPKLGTGEDVSGYLPDLFRCRGCHALTVGPPIA